MTAELVEVAVRALPVVLFLLTITVVAEIADLAGVFDVAGHAMARLAGHRTLALWALLSSLAVVVTIVLGLDTTAVLLTPVALTVARQVRVSPAPFVVTILFLANTASLFLPVSNLTNLLAAHRFARMGVDHDEMVALALAPGAAAVLATLAVVGLLHRRALSGSFVAEAPAAAHDPVLLRVCGLTCLALGPLFVLGVEPWLVSTAAAAVLVTTLGRRSPRLLRRIHPPWALALAVAGLLAAVQLALAHGAGAPVADLLGSGAGPADLARVAGVGALAANLVNNLPAYLALEQAAAASPARLMALLIGTDIGPVVTPWGSLATLLWLDRVRAAGMRVDLVLLATQGLAVAVVAGGAAVLVLAA